MLMTKNPLDVWYCLAASQGGSFARFCSRADERLATDMLTASLVGQRVDDEFLLSEISAALRLKRQHDPEVYLDITRIADPVQRACAFDRLAFRLGLRGADDVPPLEGLSGAWLRLGCSHGYVFECTNLFSWKDRTAELIRRVDPWVVYLPARGLYDDLLGAEFWNAGGVSQTPETILNHLGVACSILHARIPELYADMKNAVSQIAITEPAYSRSFSCRLAYYRGIFLDCQIGNPLQIAEGLINEYVHQRVWLWWAYEDVCPDDLDKISIESPMSGRRRSVRVMLHAFFIYSFARTFLESMLLDRQLDSSWRDWGRSRRDVLAGVLPKLFDALLEASGTNAAVLRLLKTAAAALAS